MSVHVKFMRFFSVFLGIILSCNLQLKAEILNFILLFAGYRFLRESIDYPIDVINNTELKKQIFQ